MKPKPHAASGIRRLRQTAYTSLFLALAVFAVSTYFSEVNNQDLRKANAWVLHTQQILTLTNELQVQATSFQNQARGYIITENEAMRLSALLAKEQCASVFDSLRHLAADNPAQTSLLEEIRLINDSLFRNIEAAIQRTVEGDQEASIALISSMRGKKLMDRFTEKLNLVKKAESSLLQGRIKKSNRLYDLVSQLNIFLVLVAASGLILAIYFILKALNRRENLEKSIRNENRFRLQLLNDIPESILVFEPDGKASFVNSEARKSLSYSNEDELLSRIFEKHRDDYQAKTLKEWLVPAFEGKALIEPALYSQGSFDQIYRFTAQPFFDEYGAISRVILLVNDVRLQEQILLLNEQAKLDAIESEETKQRLLKKVSHEMRTPLNVILGRVQTLFPEVKQEQQAALEDMMQAGNQLLALIHETLQDGSTLETWELKKDDTQEDEEEKLLKGKRFLLLEDNSLNQKLMQSLLKRYQVQIDIADDGLIGLELCRKNQYDIILCDLQMPNLDGYGFIKAFRNELQENTPVIALSAQVFEKERKSALDAGMDGFVGKPFKKEELFLSIRHLLQSESNAPNFEPLEKLTMGDFAFMIEMLENYLETMDQYLHDFDLVTDESDRKELKRLAHKLRSTAQIVSLAGMDQALKKLEEDENSNWEKMQQMKREICHGFYAAFPAVKNKLESLKKA